MTEDPLFIMVAVAMLAVVVILAIGISQFGKGTREAAKRSNKMMQLRIAAQFVAVLLILAFVAIRGSMGAH
ncbi:twin transmembrane helix small protein [Aquicoccus sp. SCR17]|nr:twin transmembrane helix small protein [Carideicomes alvinocaridis]